MRQPQGNGIPERFIRTRKEQILHGRVFGSLEELRRELDRFVEVYNERWLVPKHDHKTPNQIKAEQKEKALEEGAPSMIKTAARMAKHRARNRDLVHRQ